VFSSRSQVALRLWRWRRPHKVSSTSECVVGRMGSHCWPSTRSSPPSRCDPPYQSSVCAHSALPLPPPTPSFPPCFLAHARAADPHHPFASAAPRPLHECCEDHGCCWATPRCLHHIPPDVFSTQVATDAPAAEGEVVGEDGAREARSKRQCTSGAVSEPPLDATATLPAVAAVDGGMLLLASSVHPAAVRIASQCPHRRPRPLPVVTCVLVI